MHQMDENHHHRRTFERFRSEFGVKIYGVNRDGDSFDEIAELRDISGEGAKFYSPQPDNYYKNQALEITIYLPGSTELNAQMLGRAVVIRIETFSHPSDAKQIIGANIGLQMVSPLKFERTE